MAKSYKALEQDIKNDKYGYVQLVQMMDQLQPFGVHLMDC